MRENNPKIDKIMNRTDEAKNRREILPVLGFGIIGAIMAYYVMVGGAMWVEWRSNLMSPLDCVQVLNQGLLWDEVEVTPEKCDFLKQEGIIEYDVDSDIWRLVNPNNEKN
jgi:hypothetical protein